MKQLNRTLQTGSGNPLAALRSLELLLESALPEATRLRAEPLLLVQHVIASLRLSLFRPARPGRPLARGRARPGQPPVAVGPPGLDPAPGRGAASWSAACPRTCAPC